MDPAKTGAADALRAQFPSLSLAEAYTILERHQFNLTAAADEVRSRFVASAGDHGVLYEMPPPAPGPEGVRNVMDELFNRRERVESDEGQAFFGSGRRLGHTAAQSPVIPASVRQQRTITVAVYANEIRIDGGADAPVSSIPLQTPEAREFMEAMRAGVVPRSLEALYPNCELNVELQDRMDRDYQQPAVAFTAFQDAGHRLGATASNAAAATSAGSATDTSYHANRPFVLDTDQETTVIRIVNSKGAQTEVKVNPAVHTVEDLYTLAHGVEVELQRFILEVRELPPRKLGPETRTLTIAEAKLKRAVVMMRPL